MAGTCSCAAFSLAVWALLLELLDEAWRDLLLREDGALAIALFASMYIFFVISACSYAVRTDHLPIIRQFKIFAGV